MGSGRNGAGGETAHGSAEGFRGKTAGPYEETAPVYPDFCCFQLCSGASCPDLRGGSAAQADDSLDKATESLVKVDGALDDFGKVFDNVNSLVDSSSKAVEQTMDKVDQMDIESLNNAISDLNDVVAPMAEFFGRFR